MASAGAKATPKRIGLLFVHGVGEQTRFNHLSSEVRNLIEILEADCNVERLTVTTETSRDGTLGGEAPTWRAEGIAPVVISFASAGEAFEVECREVWWADINDGRSIKTQTWFWSWGLGQWLLRRKSLDAEQRDALRKLNMQLPQRRTDPDAPVGKGTRVRLFLIGAYFSLVLVTLFFANLVLSRIFRFRIPGADIIVRYVGDVKLYQQDFWLRRDPPISGTLEEPRVAIRRRAIYAMIEMARADYDRWYILAHSLGTVVAFNALTETAHALPNYLSKAQWKKITDADSGVKVNASAEVSDVGLRMDHPQKPTPNTADMNPTRPLWLAPEDCIDRNALFGRLAGLLTYGSPLNKFAGLWPTIVPENLDRTPFKPGFEWINVFDQTDTIAGVVDEYEDREEHAGEFVPKNIRYSAAPWLLLSHLRYLRPKSKPDSSLIKRVADWVVSGAKFDPPKDSLVVDQNTSRFTLRLVWTYFQWAVLALVLATLAHYFTLGIVARFFGQAMESALKLAKIPIPSIGLDELPIVVPILAAAFTVTFIFGLIHRILTRPR